MLSDARYALRQLAKRPGFTAVAVLTLALGIGVNTTMFSVLNALVLRASSALDPGRLVLIFRTSAQAQDWPQSPANFYDYEGRNTAFEQIAAFYQTNFNLAEPGQPAERLAGMGVSGSLFTLFGVPPELGRVFGPEYDRAGLGQVAVLSDGFWRSHYGADPGVIGRLVRMDGQQVTIIGVMPPKFDNPLYWGRVDLWRPLGFENAVRQTRDNAWMQAIGRLKPGVTLSQAQSEASAIASRLAREYPRTNAGSGLRLAFWDDARTSDLTRRIAWLCMGLAAFVLLIACANLANLQLARMAERVREHAVRIALGASRAQLIRQLVVESLVLSAVGGAVGVLIASWGVRLIGAGVVITGVRGFAMPVDARVLAFTLVASVLTGLAVGTIPAWMASRTDVHATLKQGARGSTGDRSRHVFRQALIVAELALALTLLTGAGYFVRGMQRAARADPGWRPEGLVTASMTLPFNANYATDAQCRAFFDKLGAKLDGLPGAQQSTIGAYLPITGFWRTAGMAIDGRAPPARGKEPLAYLNFVSPGYFSTLGMRIVRGRAFTDADRAGSQNVAIINEAMARGLFPGEDPIGKRIAGADTASPDWMVIVGVVSDSHATLELVRRPDTLFVTYLPLAQTPTSYVHWINLAIRSSAPGATVAAALRAAVQQIDPDQPVYGIATAAESMEEITSGLSLTSQMLGAFAFVGLVLSAVGIYGVIANLVAQRTAEIGIRMALGAPSADIVWLVLGQGVRLAAAGTAIGLAFAWALVRLLDAVLPSIPGGDPAAVACVAAMLAAVALLASWLPARRATEVDPIIALRSE